MPFSRFEYIHKTNVYETQARFRTTNISVSSSMPIRDLFKPLTKIVKSPKIYVCRIYFQYLSQASDLPRAKLTDFLVVNLSIDSPRIHPDGWRHCDVMAAILFGRLFLQAKYWANGSRMVLFKRLNFQNFIFKDAFGLWLNEKYLTSSWQNFQWSTHHVPDVLQCYFSTYTVKYFIFAGIFFRVLRIFDISTELIFAIWSIQVTSLHVTT